MDRSSGVRPLSIITDLFAGLNAGELSYCHWKSNINLDRSLTGQADLDLLVDVADRAPFEALLADLRFVRLTHTGPKRTLGLEDYLGFDDATGALVHLHLHYRLVLGEQRVKNHHLPVERWLLGNGRMMKGVRVPRAQDELLLLYVRSILKSDTRACVRAWLRKPSPVFPAAIVTELKWLSEQTTADDVVAACRASGLGIAEDDVSLFLARLRTGRLTPSYVFAQKRALVRQLRRYQRYSTVRCVARKIWFRLRYTRVVRAVAPLPRKRLDGSGRFVVLAGADGSGKTTLATDLPRWLGWKLESRRVYFGQPKRSLVATVLRRARRVSVAAGGALIAGPSAPIGRGLSGVGRLMDALLWAYMARHRRAFDREARARVRDGHVVFAERFPLRAFWEMDVPMDGPRLRPQPSDGPLLRRLGRVERSLYEGLQTPEHVIVLTAGLPTLRARKPETPLEEHRAKVRAIAQVAGRHVHDTIDAERPYAEVLLEAKRLVWSFLSPVSAPAVTARGGARLKVAAHL